MTQSRASGRWLRRSAWALGLGALLVYGLPLACYVVETPTARYRSAAEANLFAPGSYLARDFPGFQVPPSARALALTTNYDTSDWWLRFTFARADSATLVQDLRRLPPEEAQEVDFYRPFWLRHWHPALTAERFDGTRPPPDRLWVYTAPDRRAHACLAVDWQAAAAFAWRCVPRAA